MSARWLDCIKTRFESFVDFNPVAYLAAYLPSVYIEALEPPLIDRLLILNLPFDKMLVRTSDIDEAVMNGTDIQGGRVSRGGDHVDNGTEPYDEWKCIPICHPIITCY